MRTFPRASSRPPAQRKPSSASDQHTCMRGGFASANWLGQLAAHCPDLTRCLAEPWRGSRPSADSTSLLENYVERGGMCVDAGVRKVLRADLAAIMEWGISLRGGAHRQAALIVEFFCRFLSGAGSAGPRGAALRRSVNESAFGLIDFILRCHPAAMPSRGAPCAEGAAVLKVVLSRNCRVLRDFAGQIGASWSDLISPHPAPPAGLPSPPR